ncbi:MAG: hypothetical protein A2053_06120 [Deltaproteobacteria bacterium GWA2_50_8]|nr:MAG: hypothetical protein A2053_06120 [Deltaproteobacteria bacterium GWA2_50_8]OGQ27029.1 MAG: hypothetical protein A3B79_07340 [Deltaproteobacteria bacterium RIFCSPHIGHO2_02_FULL_50_15]
MTANKTKIFLSLFIFLLSGPLWAEGEKTPPPWYEKVSVGGEIRLRSETQIDYANIAGGVDDDSFVLLRVRPHIEAKPTSGLRLFIQPQFSRVFAQEESTIANTAATRTNNDDFDLHQGYIDFQDIGGSPLSLRLGRQELNYGDQRLVGAFGWNNVGRNFDAAKASLKWETLWVEAFFSLIERVAGNQYFGGLYGHWDVRPSMAYEPFVLVLRDNDGSATGASLTLVTFGDRLTGKFYDDRIDYGLEAALQAGKSQPNTHFAYAAHAAGGYTFLETTWRPRLGLDFNTASGDDPATTRVERFNNLFPTNHDKYGYIDFASWRNIYDISPVFSLQPVAQGLIELSYHLFLLPEVSDGLFRSSGAQLRAGAAGASRVAGHEIDLSAKYTWNKWANFLLGYSLFKGGDFFADTGTNGTAHFLYIQTQANF